MRPGRGAAALALALLAACGGGRKDPVLSTPFPVPTDTTPPAPESRISPRAVVGTWRGDAAISNGASRTRRATRTQIRLESAPAAVPAEGSASGTQYNATVTLPGYTRAPRGRSGQAAAWWPGTLDSIVVQFTNPQGNLVQMRGAVAGRRMQGEIWMVSAQTGSSFQLGSFVVGR